MEMNSKDILAIPVSSNKSNQEVAEVAYMKFMIKNNFKLLCNNTDKVSYLYETQQLPHQSQNPQFPVPHLSPPLLTKNENVLKNYNKSKAINSENILSTCSNNNNCEYVKSKLSNRHTNENKPCSSQSVSTLDIRHNSDRKQDGNSNGPCIPSNKSRKNNSPPTFMKPVELETEHSQDNFFSLGYSGHWVEIKDENREEIKDKFLPECGIDESRGDFVCSTEERYCKSPDLENSWSHFAPLKKYVNNNRKRCKDKLIKCFAQYSYSQCGADSSEEQVSRKRKILHSSSFSSHKESTNNIEKNCVMASPVVAITDRANNKEVDSSVGVAADFVGSWLEIEDEKKERLEYIVIPDDSNCVEDIDSGNGAVLVEGVRTSTEELFTSGENEDTPATLWCDSEAISNTQKQGILFLLDEQRNQMVADKESTNKDLWREHISSHFVDCHECGITFQSDKRLKQHINKVHSVKTYLCPECNDNFKTSTHKLKHLRLCHSDKYPQFTCSLCKLSFVQKNKLTEHLLKLHLKEKNFLCSDCGQSFFFKKQLRKHRLQHSTERLFKCSDCEKSFKSKRVLTNHIKTHSGKKPHSCVECGRSFLRSSNLRCHMQLHGGEKKFHCEICKGSFFSRPSLTMHMARHLSGHPVIKYTLKCLICYLDMRHLKTSLKIHLKQHSLRPKAIGKGDFYCHVCNKRFKSKYSLGCHLNIHGKENSFKCVKCKTVFRHFISLLCHSYLHLRTKKFLCIICRKEFSRTKGLVEHLKVHSSIYSYKCFVCKLRFQEQSALVRHVKQHVEERRLHCAVGRQSFCLKTQAVSHQS